MSEVTIVEREYEIASAIKSAAEIWIAQDLKKSKVIRELKFSKETHHKKSVETTFQERASVFLLKEPLKTKGQLKAGQTIDLLFRRDNAYDESDVRRYHESGESRSPLIYVDKATHKINGDQVVLFFSTHNGNPELHISLNDLIEGAGVVAEIKSGLRTDADLAVLGTLPSDRFFKNMPDDVSPKTELFPGVYLIYHRLIHADPVVTELGLFDVAGKSKMGFSLPRLKELFAKRKAWPLTDAMIRNLAQAVSEGTILESKEEIPRKVPEAKYADFHQFTIERKDSKVIAKWYTLWSSSTFPSALNGHERPFKLMKHRMHLERGALTLESEFLGNEL